MPVYTPGGGGGPSRQIDENTTDALSRPYDVGWPATADTMQQINEMFDILFKSNVKRADDITTLQSGLAGISFSSDLITARRIITNAEIDTLNATPITIVPAPGVGLVNIPILWAIHVSKAVNPWSTTSNFRLRFSGIATDLCATIAASLTSAGAIELYSNGIAQAFAISASDPTNKPLVVDLAADVTQNTGGAASAEVEVAYYILGAQ